MYIRRPILRTRGEDVKRRAFLLFVSFLCFLSLLPWISGAASLTILHTNDTHGHLMPFSYPAVVAAESSLEGLRERSNIGGIARRATLVKRIREELKQQGTPVWLVDAGDFCDGTPFSTEYHGEADVSAMNAAGYDFATLGNHEFNNTLAQMKKLIAMARYPILCANAVDAATGEPLTRPYVIEQAGPVRVGIFGLVTHEAATYPAAKKGVTIGEEVETARRVIAELRGKADIILLISHIGQEYDEKVAAAVSGIDVIVGAHSHSRLPVGELIWRSDELRADEINGTIIVQAHQWGGELGRLDLLFEKDSTGVWHVDRYRSRLIPVTSEVEPDDAVAAVVDQYWKPIAARYGEVIGLAAGDFCSRGDDRAEYNLVADAIREAFGTEIEMENLGGVRAPLIKGEITRADLVALDPFSNTVVTFKIAGREIRRIVQEHTPAVSGIRYRVEDGRLVEITINGQPLEEDRVYAGAANSYFARYALRGIDLHDSGTPRLDVLIRYIREKGTIHPAYDGRRVVVGAL